MRAVRRFHDRARRYGFRVAAGQVSRRHHIQVIGPASNAQGHQDRREKRQRVHARFQRVLTAANMLAAITAPLQRGSRGAWTPEQHMTEEDRSRLGDLAAGELVPEPVAPADWLRIAELVAAYRDLPLGTVDSSVVAACERIGAHSIATLDRRHFSVVRPSHTPAFDLVP